MTQEQLLSGLKKDVRSLLVSAKNGLSPDQLKRDYFSMLGHPLPLRSLGFRNVMDMVKEMPDVVSVDYATDGSMVLKVVGDQTTKGIQELVSRQRNPKSKAAARKPLFGSHFPRYAASAPPLLPRRGQAPPALPAQLRCQLRQLLSQGPVGLSELEPCFARLFGRPLQVGHYGFYSVAELLAAAADLVDVRQSRAGSLLVLKIPQKPLGKTVVKTVVKTASPAVSLPPSTPGAGKGPADAGEQNALIGSHGSQPNLPPELGPRGTPENGRQLSEADIPALKPVLEEKTFETCVKKLEEQFRNGILESGPAGTVSPELKNQLCQVVAENSAGISIHDFPGEFKRVNGADLPVVQCGFLSVTEMVSALSDILYLEPGPEKEANSWIVKGNQQERGQDTGLVTTETSEAGNPSGSGYYLNSEDSPWEGRGREEEPSEVLEADTELRVTTKTFSQVVDAFPVVAVPTGGACPVPPDAVREERLRAPTRRPDRELAPVLVEKVESPSHFYIRFHRTPEARALENMMIEMRACYTCPEVTERYRLPERYVRPGQVCCFAPHGVWFYRVVIHRVLSPGQAQVYYADFGDLSVADISSLRFLKYVLTLSSYPATSFLQSPPSLTGVRPVSGSWSPGAVSLFQKLCGERPLVAAIHSYRRGVLHLFLCDTHTPEDVYVHTALQGEGHALSCTPFYSRVIFGQFNPVALYMETGLHEERTGLCSLDPAENSPVALQDPLGASPTGPSPEGGVQLQPIREEVDLPDLPELEFISIPEVNSTAQVENPNPFGALLCTSSEVFSDWDRGWDRDSTPGGVPEEAQGPGDTVELCPGQKGSVVEKPSGAGPPDQSESGPRSQETTPVRTRDCAAGVSGLAGQQSSSSYLFPWLRHASPTVLGPAAQLAAGAHLLSWYPHKMA
ncbi:hypothetical protein COCON_G00058060 [Conger conger]|uniref:Tudor domain-containing protein 5 n=1 Tax=Conger conger TaxID=82655 RepID=A0A9Q1DQV0_CONCO|nr:hypothetical protein COCON_G00058060 [Conger conger]